MKGGNLVKEYKLDMYIYRNMVLMIVFGVFYAFLESHIPFWQFIPDALYRVIYFVIFIVVAVAPLYRFSILMLGGNLLLATTVEDYVYWLVLDKTPYTWMPLYVVWGGYVINDIVQGVLVIVLYYAYFRLEMKKMKKDN